jgi:hypothetical protein
MRKRRRRRRRRRRRNVWFHWSQFVCFPNFVAWWVNTARREEK